MKHCSVCRNAIDSESPAILTMTALANPKYLCEECERDFDNATLSKDPEEISAAIEKIGKKMQDANNDDKLILETVTNIISSATERGELIRNGVYDFSNDTATEEEGDELVPEELLESEEDRELDKKEEEARKKVDKVMNYFMIGAFIAALSFVIYRLIIRFI